MADALRKNKDSKKENNKKKKNDVGLELLKGGSGDNVGNGDGVESAVVAGRKSKYCEETVDLICKGIEAGMGKYRCCRQSDKAGNIKVNITYQTFRNWEKKYPEFAERVEQASKAQKMAIHDEALSWLRVHMPKNWTCCAWILERLFPEVYALKKDKEGLDVNRTEMETNMSDINKIKEKLGKDNLSKMIETALGEYDKQE
jgi:hypothetical protein